MKSATKREQLLRELQQNTGIEFAIVSERNNDGEETLSQLERLVKSYKASERREYFLERVLRGELSSAQILQGMNKFHIDKDIEFGIYYIEVLKQTRIDVQDVLESLFLQQNYLLVVPMSTEHFVILKGLQPNEQAEQSAETAQMILDVLNTEAMLNARVACGQTKGQLDSLKVAYQEACTAMKIGKIFYMQDYIFDYGKLGLGRLICELPLDVCENYIKEVFGNRRPKELDEEMAITIKVFFDNGLNISETARKLYVHRNTLVYRLEKIEKAIGLDIRNFDNALTYKVVAMVMEYIAHQQSDKR